ncbi:class I SAM-dependent methyltransferase [Campylobacter sp. IFREMER_LSEM_CL1846]|uniref:class I SAM-dependent methyltransferase n=1 Tax=unclassified Campylobacter TaxID=2593542 RepID=UPI0021E6B96B|nr:MULTISPECIES: class I SAM-dependent methyltransferase [unclassified Campylobacter]HEC1747401.1 class I SAM-dependent methyltransferase [Campylobacter lari]MCV3433766.1 class I SAM-dependent methyltransferase [Campylobacter sp. IFREMER_LSEM_CL1846]MCV3508336.1 class I SAM-dependent methyltransferase [Campylobacter sp. CNRCH_2016_3089]HEC1769191.1 class I SAM-dependent methyltransferase [Campylobacter lari]HEC1788680.1 class I SAM-dependent methyltransferase [Campylobacter lari]
MNLWNKKAKSYARYSSNLNEIQKVTFAKLGSLQDKSVVDIGCGSGVWTLHLAQKAKSVLGVDSSSAMLEILQEDAKTHAISNIKTLNLDFENFYKNNNTNFDLAFLSMSPALQNEKDYKAFLNLASKKVYLGWASRRKSSFLDPIFEHFNTHFKGFYEEDLQSFLNAQNISYESEIFNETRVVKRDKDSAIENALWHLSMNGINANKQELESFVKDEVEEIIEAKIKLLIID